MKSKCPICKEENNCAITKGENPVSCWCMQVTILPEVLERASAEKDQCICKKCIDEQRIELL